jgi:hypothetical protein
MRKQNFGNGWLAEMTWVGLPTGLDGRMAGEAGLRSLAPGLEPGENEHPQVVSPLERATEERLPCAGVFGTPAVGDIR